MSVGDTVHTTTCAACGVGVIRRIADGQALVDFANRPTWVDLTDLEVV